MENLKYKLSKKNYNSDKTFVQILKSTHNDLKKYCEDNGLKIKDFLNDIIIKSIK